MAVPFVRNFCATIPQSWLVTMNGFRSMLRHNPKILSAIDFCCNCQSHIDKVLNFIFGHIHLTSKFSPTRKSLTTSFSLLSAASAPIIITWAFSFIWLFLTELCLNRSLFVFYNHNILLFRLSVYIFLFILIKYFLKRCERQTNSPDSGFLNS